MPRPPASIPPSRSASRVSSKEITGLAISILARVSSRAISRARSRISSSVRFNASARFALLPLRSRPASSRLIRVLNLLMSIGQAGDEWLVTVFGQFVLFGGNDEDIAFDLRAAFVKVAQFLAVFPDPIGLFRLCAVVGIVQSRRPQRNADIRRFWSLIRLRDRASKDDLLNQFAGCD